LIENTDALIKALNENRIGEGESMTLQLIGLAEQSFMDQLTLETATDLIGVVLLYCEFCSKEKKPWKATVQMERIEGALRFLADFMSDRDFAAKTLYRIASYYAYACFYPEAQRYYELCLDVSPEFDDAEDAVYFALINAFRTGLDSMSEAEMKFEKVLGSDRFRAVFTEAKNAFSSEILRDPLEREERFLKIRYDLEKSVDEFLVNSEEDLSDPFCIRYWNAKKRLLSERFGLEWKTPAEMNPEIQFC